MPDPDTPLTKANLRLAQAVLGRDTFTYEDLSLATGDSRGAIRRRLSGPWKEMGLYPFEDTDQRRSLPQGRHMVVHRLSAEARARLEAMVSHTQAEATVIEIGPEDVPDLELLDAFLKDTMGEAHLLYKVRQSALAQQDLEDITHQLDAGGVVLTRPNAALAAQLDAARAFVERVQRDVTDTGARRAARIARQAKSMTRRVGTRDLLLGQIEPLVEEAQATQDPLDLVILLACSAALTTRRGRFDGEIIEVLEARDAFDLAAQAIALSREIAQHLPTWRPLADQAFGGAFMCETLREVEVVRAAAQASHHLATPQAQARFEAYAPLGTSAGVGDGLGIGWGAGHQVNLPAHLQAAPQSSDSLFGLPSLAREIRDLSAQGIARLGLGDPSVEHS